MCAFLSVSFSPSYQSSNALLDGKAYSFLQVVGSEEQAPCGSYRNKAEAHSIVSLIYQLSSSAKKDKEWHCLDKIRIITFYRAQVALIKQLLRQKGFQKVLVATVDSSQGCEADLVIVSFVRSNNGRRPSQTTGFLAGFLNDDRRMNVALTRARHQLICIGNAQAMNNTDNTSTIWGLVTDAKERDCILIRNHKDFTTGKKRQQSAVPSSKSNKKKQRRQSCFGAK